MPLYSETSTFEIRYFDQTFILNNAQQESFANQMVDILDKGKPRFIFLPADETEAEEWQFSAQVLIGPGVSLSIREVRGPQS